MVPSVRIPVTERCTLKCRDCVSRMTEFKNPIDYPFESITEDIDAIFKHIKYVESFRFVGGEPFLNKKLDQLIEYVGVKYRAQMGEIVIVSNGAIIPNNRIFDTMEKYGVILRISNYTNSVAVKNKQKISQITSKINNYKNIKLEIAIEDGIWYKYSKKNSLEMPEKSIEKFYDECICGASIIVKDKKLYPCVVHAAEVKKYERRLF